MLPLTRSRNRSRFFGAQQSFSPASLFAGGTVAGAWYDPSDLSTLFTTSAGTTQCAMPGLGSAVSVGAMLDKRATGYSVSFTRSPSSYLTAPNTDSRFNYGTGAFTIEAWVYLTALPSGNTYPQAYWVYGGGPVSSITGLDFYIGSTQIGFNLADFNLPTVIGNHGMTTATWYHVAVVRGGSSNQTVSLYVNGTRVATASSVTATADPCLTGVAVSAAEPSGATEGNFQGYISNVRAVKGAAVYDPTQSTLTVPAASLSPISGTSLLTCGTTWSGNPAITSVGNTRIDGLNPFTASPVGNHAIAFNNVSARPVLMARVNLLTYSEEFDNGAWTKTNATAANTSATTDPLGGTTAEIITALAGTAGKFVRQNLIVPSNVTFSVYAKADTQRYIQLLSDGDTEAYANFDLQAGAGQTGTKGTKTTSSITDVGNGWYRCVATFTGATAGVSARVFFVDNASALWFANSTTTGAYYLWGADLRPANIGANVPAYQRIADANTYDTSGFPLYLFFDGIDDSMYTPANLNLSGTDKATVFAGVRKLSDAGYQVITSNGVPTTENRRFAFFSTYNASGDYAYQLAGSSFTTLGAAETTTQFAAPRTDVTTSEISISVTPITSAIQLRVNQANQALSQLLAYSTSATTFADASLQIGRRSDNNFFLNGQVYGLLVVGSAVSAGNISATEQWVAGKTGIVIP